MRLYWTSSTKRLLSRCHSQISNSAVPNPWLNLSLKLFGQNNRSTTDRVWIQWSGRGVFVVRNLWHPSKPQIFEPIYGCIFGFMSKQPISSLFLFEFFTKHFFNDPISFAVWNFPWCLYSTKVRSSGSRLKGQLFNEIVPHIAVLYATTLGFYMWTMHIPLKQTCILL